MVGISRKCQMKKIINVLSVGMVIGFLLGFVLAVEDMVTNRHLIRLMVFNLQASVNKWTITCLSVVLGLTIFPLAARFVWKIFFSKMIEVHVKDKNKLLAFVLSSVVFVSSGWAINHYWLPNKFHPVSLLADMGILFFAVISGKVLVRINWKELFAFKHSGFIRISALTLLVCFLLLNVGINIESKFNTHAMPNVILISIDTLRADHLGCYGYSRNTSPNIDSFAKDNILFENCFVHEPSTAPSHMSMLTGLYPVTHGVSRRSAHALDKSTKTLAEILKSEGYRTFGFVRKCEQLRPEFGFARGFDVYKEKDYTAESQNKAIVKQLKKNKNKKLFLFLHYYDVHSDWDKLPYDVPAPYQKMFYPDYKGDFTGGEGKFFASEYLSYVNRDNIMLKEDDLKYITALYDGGIAYTDKYLGDLFGILKKLGLYDKSMIILTSDHGEEFQGHGFMMHDNPFYYDELMHVPMIIKLPGTDVEGKVVTRLVENIDIMPSILEVLGVKNAPRMQGDSFVKLIENPQANWKDFVFGYSVKHGPRAFIRNSRWKLVAADIRKEDQFKVFDLSNDPGEKFDIKGNPDDVTEQLQTKLLERYMEIEKAGTQKEVTITSEQLKILKSLGYVE